MNRILWMTWERWICRIGDLWIGIQFLHWLVCLWSSKVRSMLWAWVWSCWKASSFHDVSWESDLSSSSSKVFQLVAFAVWEQSDSDHGDKVMNWFLHLIFQPAPSIAFPFFQLSGKHSLLLKIWHHRDASSSSAMPGKKSIQNGFHCLFWKKPFLQRDPNRKKNH